MKRLLLLCACLYFAHSGQAQVLPCLYDLGVDQLERQYPGYRDHSHRTVKEAVQAYHQRRDPDGSLFTIPVVIHVVWKEAEENISDARIEAQIRVLNEAFRRQNADTVNTRSDFQAVVGDAGIEFVLADIIRVQTDTLFAPEASLFGGVTLPDHVKQTANGGSDATDPVNHLNIWVCALQPISIFGTESPVLGFAYPPAGLDNWPAETPIPEEEFEGVVVDYRTVGDNEVYSIPAVGDLPMLGRTTVHEVGHYLGLRHTSGDGALAALGVPDCDVDDGVADTPNQGLQSQFNCDFSQNTCTDDVADLPDMVENYMDYSREDCQNSFTKGQIEIMRAVLTGPRAELPAEVTSSAEAQSATHGRLYPNPSSGVFYLELAEQQQSGSWQLFDGFGRLIMQSRYTAPTIRLDLQGHPAGLYFLQVKDAAGRQASWTLVRS